MADKARQCSDLGPIKIDLIAHLSGQELEKKLLTLLIRRENRRCPNSGWLGDRGPMSMYFLAQLCVVGLVYCCHSLSK